MSGIKSAQPEMDVVKESNAASTSASEQEVAPSSSATRSSENKRKREVESKDDLHETTRPRSYHSLSVRCSALELTAPSITAYETAMIRSDSLRAANGIARPTGIPRSDSVRAANAVAWSDASAWCSAVEATKSISSMSIATMAVTQAVALRSTSPQTMAIRASSPSAFGMEDAEEWQIGKGVYFF